MATQKSQSVRKRQRGEADECYGNSGDGTNVDDDEEDFIIPTPSIDSVLQSLATNALASSTRRSSSGRSSSNSSCSEEPTKKVKKMQPRVRCHLRVNKWKKREKQRKQTCAPKTCSNDGGETSSATNGPKKQSRTLADMLQYSSVVTANQGKFVLTPSSSVASPTVATATDFTPVQHYPSSSKSIATLITDRFRPYRGTFYRYIPAPPVPPATVHRLTLNNALRQPVSSTIDAAVSNVFAKCVSDVWKARSSSSSCSTPPLLTAMVATQHNNTPTTNNNNNKSNNAIGHEADASSSFTSPWPCPKKSSGIVRVGRPKKSSSAAAAAGSSANASKQQQKRHRCAPVAVVIVNRNNERTVALTPNEQLQQNGCAAGGAGTARNGGEATMPMTVTNCLGQQQLQQPQQHEDNDDDVVLVLDDSSDEQEEQQKQDGQAVAAPTAVEHQQGKEMDQGTAEEDGEESTEPFCKKCASEIPLILKNLDRLDNMVTSMLAAVEGAIQSRQQRQRQCPPNS